MSEEYIGPKELIDHLRELIDKIDKEEFTPLDLQDIYDSTEEYIKTPEPINPDIIRTILFGSLIVSQINNNPVDINICPYCTRSMEE